MTTITQATTSPESTRYDLADEASVAMRVPYGEGESTFFNLTAAYNGDPEYTWTTGNVPAVDLAGRIAYVLAMGDTIVGITKAS